jgi:hypothetical protein
MKRIQLFLAIGVAAISLASLTGCSLSGENGSSSSSKTDGSTESIELSAEPPGIRGFITKADSTAGSSNILVEEDPADASGSSKASVRIKDETKIYRRTGGSLEKSSKAALTVGKQVSVWFEGPVAESYPVQGTASVVVLED